MCESAIARQKPLLRRSSGLFTAVLAVPLVATAQNVSETPTDQRQDQARYSGQLEEIIVTATKRAERLQDIANAVSVLSTEQLERTGTTNIRDFAASVPGVTIVPIENSTTKIVIRGVSTGNNFEATSSATGMYLDDVPMGSSFGSGGAELATFDLQRVEILRGPQGTLYGAGSAGGTVRYVTNPPDVSTFEGSVSVSGAITEGETSYQARGVLNLPLVPDSLAVRAVGYYRDADGYIDNVQTGQKGANFAEVSGGRLSMLWNATDRLSISMLGAYQKSDLGVSSWTDASQQLRPLAGDLKQSLSVVPEPATVRSKLASLRIEYDLDWGTFTSATSVTDFERAETIDDTFFQLGTLTRLLVPGTTALSEVFSTKDEGFYEEARLASSDPDARLTWLAGVFYRDYTLDARRPLMPTPFPGFFSLDLQSHQKARDIAAFGQLSYDLNDQWEVTAGGRYTRATNYFGQSLAGLFINPAAPTVPIVSPARKASETHFSPRVELSFRPAPGKLIYALASEGFRAGGPNVQYPAPIPAVPETYSEDRVWNYELGAKTSWFDERMILNASIFDVEIETLQVVTVIPGFGLPYIANAGDARSRGVELELQARPTAALNLAATATYDEAEFTTPAPDLRVDRAGTPIPQVPKWTFTAAVDYARPLGARAEGFVHFDYRHIDSTLSLLANQTSDAVVLPEYDIGNFRIGVAFDAGTEISLFVQNVWDERAYVQAIRVDGSTPAGLRLVTLQPRTIGLELTQRF